VTDWELVGALARAQESAVAGRRWDELLEIQATMHAVLADAGSAPESAREILEKAYESSRSAERMLFGSLAERKGLLERLRSGRRAAAAYALNSR
jgi:hypothetical protein